MVNSIIAKLSIKFQGLLGHLEKKDILYTLVDTTQVFFWVGL